MKKRGKRIRLWLLFLGGLLFLIAVLIRTRIDPVTRQLALAQVSDAASKSINEAIEAEIADGTISYDKIVLLDRDEAGAVVALRTNMQEVNRLKTELLSLLDDDIYTLNDEEIGVPLGNLTGLQLLSGRGARIPVKVLSISSSDARFTGEFSAAGINQTLHRLMLQVELEITVLLPTGTAKTTVVTDVCVAETVLVGPVPQSYTYFSDKDSEDSLERKYYASQ